jgi:hypothetical protein
LDFDPVADRASGVRLHCIELMLSQFAPDCRALVEIVSSAAPLPPVIDLRGSEMNIVCKWTMGPTGLTCVWTTDGSPSTDLPSAPPHPDTILGESRQAGSAADKMLRIIVSEWAASKIADGERSGATREGAKMMNLEEEIAPPFSMRRGNC